MAHKLHVLDAVDDVNCFSLSSSFIPISLLTSFQFLKYFQGYFLEKRSEFQSESYNMKCQTSQLNEDLGLIDYIFSDKTGTLTKNSMKFRSLFANNKRYGRVSKDSPAEETSQRGSILEAQEDDSQFSSAKHSYTVKVKEDLESSSFKNMIIFEILNCCHEVIIKKDHDGETHINASSPDEVALIEAASSMGFVLEEIDDHNNEIVVSNKINQSEERFKRIAMFRFSSDRARMSVIVKNQQSGQYHLLVKGADHVIIERTREYSGFSQKDLEAQLQDYSNVGLRTLVYAYKTLTQTEVDQILKKIETIENNLGTQKQEQLALLAEEIEKGLTTVGASAVEDELQDDVAETLQNLRQANIKVWMLTGDKLETAIKISHSSGLVGTDDHIICLKAEEEMVNENEIEHFFSQLENIVIVN